MTADRRSAHLDLQGAADALGIHYQTAYRWVRSGKLPAVVVDGHYQLDPHEVAEVARRREEPARPPAPSPARVRREAERVHEALIDGDEPAVERSVQRLLAEGLSATDICQHVLAPSLRLIGEAWAGGRVTIWVEHRASAIVEVALAGIMPNPRGRRRGTAVVAALSGDRHALPTTMATIALRDDNWRVEQLGADTPPEEVLDFCAGRDVDLVVITVTTDEAAVAAWEAAERLEAEGLTVLIGGPGRSLDELVEAARR